MNEELDNELVVTDDVPETSLEENEIETNASEGVEEVQNSAEEVEKQPSAEDIERMIEERAKQRLEEQIETRLIRDRISRERKEAPLKAKYEELENIMKTALGADNIDDVITKSKAFYKEQGISIPEVVNKPSLNERDEIVLAKADAGDIIRLGKSEMEAEANRIASIPEKNRSLRDKTIFNDVCQELVRMKDEDSLKAKGYDTKVLNDKDFSSFRGQFNLNTPVSQIYEMYQKVNGNKPVQPKSPGSAKTNNSNNEIKDYYSPEDFDKLSDEDLRNPKIMAVVDKSRLQWYKKSLI